MSGLFTGNKFDPNTDVPNLNGKVFVVTGGSAGIGFGIVAHLLQHAPEKIYLVSNKEEHAVEAMEELKKYGDVAKVEWKQCNLEDLHQTDNVAKDLSKLDRIDALILNAGLGIGVYNETKDGIDSHMQVNHIAQFHLAMILLPILQKTPNSRLVLQSSELHRPISDVKFESLAELNRDIGPTKLYNRTKLAQILFMQALCRRAERGELGFKGANETGPWIISVHPGGVLTDQQGQAIEAYGTMAKLGVAAMKPLLKDPVEGGCRPALFAATHEDVVKDKLQGKYIVPDRKVTEVSKDGQSVELAENLWKLTTDILKDKLGVLPYQY